MFSKYYQDELDYLRELGREFAHDNPEIAHSLAEAGTDPDVERLLEGVAFLTGRVRQKLDDELPEVIHGLFELLWPHYLRPIPSFAIVEFTPREQLTGRAHIPRQSTELDAVVRGTRCRFRTCYDLEIAPVAVADVWIEQPLSDVLELHVRLRALGRSPIGGLGIDRLRFHVFGEAAAARELYAALRRDTRTVEVRVDSGKAFALDSGAVRGVGFGEDESLCPYPPHVFPGYRLLQEYFTLPSKFLFLDVVGLERLAGVADRECTLVFRLARAPNARELRGISKTSLRLHCTPVVNLMSHAGDPIVVDHRKTEYLVRPIGDAEHHEVYSVDAVVGLVRGTGERKEYHPFHAFRMGEPHDRGVVCYQTRRHVAFAKANSETRISFVTSDGRGAVPPTATVSLDLTCTNRKLAEEIRVGELNIATETSPTFATFANVTGVTPSVVPPLEGDLLWRLVSHLGLNYLALGRSGGSNVARDALRTLLGLYNVPSLYDRQIARASKLRLDNLIDVRCQPMDRLVRGTPLRGTAIEVDVREEGFPGEGDLYLFGCVLAEFFAVYATINSFTVLTVRDLSRGETYRWPPRIGTQPLV